MPVDLELKDEDPKEKAKEVTNYWIKTKIKNYGSSENTIINYRRSLTKFLEFMYDRVGEVPESVEDIELYLSHLQEKNYSRSTIINNKLQVPKLFYEHIVNYDGTNPVEEVTKNYRSKTKVGSKGRGSYKKLFLSIEEIKKLLKHLWRNNKKDLFYLSFVLAKMGLRIGEAFRLRNDKNIDLTKKYLFPQPEEGDNARPDAEHGIPFDEETKKILKKVFQKRDTLAPTRYHEKPYRKGLDTFTNWVNQALQREAKRVGVQEEDAPRRMRMKSHVFRRSLNNYLALNQGWNDITRPIYLGWSLEGGAKTSGIEDIITQKATTGEEDYTRFGLEILRKQYEKHIWKADFLEEIGI